MSRTLTLRRCNHHTLPAPLSPLACHQSVIDPKESGTNKHRYILAAQDQELRAWAREIRGVPIVYVKRSVMVMESMAEASIDVREGLEKGKLRAGVTKNTGKRKIEALEGKTHDAGDSSSTNKKKQVRGPKGPNPLSVKKKRPRPDAPAPGTSTDSHIADTPQQEPARKRRRRRHHGGDSNVSLGMNDASKPDVVSPIHDR